MIYVVFILICIIYLIILILEAVERCLCIKKEYLDKGKESNEKLESCIGFQYYPDEFEEDYPEESKEVLSIKTS